MECRRRILFQACCAAVRQSSAAMSIAHRTWKRGGAEWMVLMDCCVDANGPSGVLVWWVIGALQVHGNDIKVAPSEKRGGAGTPPVAGD